MILLWLVTSAALVAAIVALSHARRNAKRLEQLSQQYWELKYLNGELRVQLQRITSNTPEAPPATPTRPPKEAFVPLTSLKR